MTSPLEIADDIARAALEELERLPDLQSMSISRTSLGQLAEAYLHVREHSRGSSQDEPKPLPPDYWETAE